VAYNFQPVDRNQRFLLPVDMADWLNRDHFAYFVIELVEQLDLAPFLSSYRADGKGGAAYDPAAMVTLLAYAYCDGERSSRRIEEHCRTDIAYRVVMGGLTPDHTTISRFRDRHEKALADIFVPILGVCLHAGMGDVSLAAIDGSKFRCPASLRANRKLPGIERELARLTGEIEAELARIAEEILAASRRADLDDDTLFGPPPRREPGTLPDVVGLPKRLHGKAARRARLAKAKKLLDDEHRAECAAHEDRMARRAAAEAATGKKIRGRKPVPPARDPDRQINVTDPDSRIMKDAHGGYLQGYNAQNAVAKDRVNLAPQVVNDENDTQQLHPMMDQTGKNLADAGSARTVGLYLGDSGYCTDNALAGIKPDGPKVLLATKKEHKTRSEARHAPVNDGPPPDGLSPKEKMDWELDTAAGKAAYSKRAATVEPGFGHHKHNRGMFRFLRAGLTAADSEWKLINATDNMRKLYRRVSAGRATADWSTLSQVIPVSPAT
jgi:transposase